MTATLSIVITGASGFIGSAITQEALRRGHKVLALVRHVAKLADLQAAYPTQLTVQALDVSKCCRSVTHLTQGSTFP